MGSLSNSHPSKSLEDIGVTSGVHYNFGYFSHYISAIIGPDETKNVQFQHSVK